MNGSCPKGQWRVKSEGWTVSVENRLRFSSSSFLSSLFSLISSFADFVGWSVWMDSNHRPRAYQARALATWATNRFLTHRLWFIHLLVSLFFLSSVPLLCEKWRVKSEEWRGNLPVGKIGGDDGVRTHDPLLAGQVLSQLSYTPMFPGSLFQRSFRPLRSFWSL